MKILYFGAHDPEYSRNRVLAKGLGANGVEVVECCDRSRSILKYFKLIVKFLKLKKDFDVMLVGFPGQEVMFIARLLTRKPIIFDVFTSHYGGHILDRASHSPSSLHARYYKFLDRYSCLLADMILLDTDAHIDFFVKEFNLPKEKFKRIFVGTDSAVFHSSRPDIHERTIVHFVGNFIPLQGVRYIVEAAKLLEHEQITFTIIGRGQTYKVDRALAETLHIPNMHFIDRVPYRELPLYMNKADICLGIFGTTAKTDLVIPNKVFEALAMGKPLITADTPAVRELLKDKENVILCQKGNAQDLAEKIQILAGSSTLRAEIGAKAKELFDSRLTEKMLAQELIDSIYERGLLSK